MWNGGPLFDVTFPNFTKQFKAIYRDQAIETSDIALVSSKEILDIHATIECRFTLKRVRDMIRTYIQMHRTDKYSQHSSIIWSVWLNGWVFVSELSGCSFKSRCSHLEPWIFLTWKIWSSIIFPKFRSLIILVTSESENLVK